MRVTDEMVNAARSAYSVDRIPNGEIINKIAGPGYGDKLIRGIIESALSHAAGQDGEPCRAASGDADDLALTLERMADNAYCDYIRKMQRTECLGWEEKVRRGSFDSENLRAHVNAGELLGRHRALHEAAKLLRKLQQGAECFVREMRTSKGSEFFVVVRCNGRELTPHMYTERWKAEYDVASWQHLLCGAPEPDLLAYGPDAASQGQEGGHARD